ncbi:hypothetical protein BDZ85DRAFT_4505 [Elsinoe ampelina]|uniref:Uncharacterized protein n=1 Tax=Elsinoe ampelina TaxID=302913 RepID=A0A6A6GPD0_9PEZI|nr:hypothetical protein BDZ85DRAFT_4505 [Elsinoe ampelina]
MWGFQRSAAPSLQHYRGPSDTGEEIRLQWAFCVLLLELEVYSARGKDGIQLFRQHWPAEAKDQHQMIGNRVLVFRNILDRARRIVGGDVEMKLLGMVQCVWDDWTLKSGLRRYLAKSTEHEMYWDGIRMLTFKFIDEQEPHTSADVWKQRAENRVGRIGWWPFTEPTRTKLPTMAQVRWKRDTRIFSTVVPSSIADSYRSECMLLANMLKTAEVVISNSTDPPRAESSRQDSTEDAGERPAVPEAVLLDDSVRSEDASSASSANTTTLAVTDTPADHSTSSSVPSSPGYVAGQSVAGGSAAVGAPNTTPSTSPSSQASADPTPAMNLQPIVPVRRGFIYWCVDSSWRQPVLTKRADIATHGLNDCALFTRLNQESSAIKGYLRSFFSLKGCVDIEFIKFGSVLTHPSQVRRILEELPCPCKPTCKHDYRYQKSVNEEMHRRIAATEIMEGMKDPSRFHNTSDTLAIIPQDMAQTRFGRDEPAWGLHAVEGIMLWKFLVFVGIMTLAGLVFVAVWLACVDEKDLQGAFTVATFLTTMVMIAVASPQLMGIA